MQKDRKMRDAFSPREMAMRAREADRIIPLKGGGVRLERGNFAEVFVPYEWVVSLRYGPPKGND